TRCLSDWSSDVCSSDLGREMGHPMTRDILAAAHPHARVSENILDKADQCLGAAGMAGQPHVQSDGHHPRAFCSLFIEQVEAVAQDRKSTRLNSSHLGNS